MFHRRFFVVALIAFFASAVVDRPQARAKDYFLTLGGGYNPSGNQLSLERNVIFQQTILAAKRPDKPPYEVWFADGTDPHPDLQCRDPKFEQTCPPATKLLAEALGEPDSMDLIYRNNEVPNVKGPDDLKQVKQRFTELAGQTKPGDRVIIYVAGHGGRARRGGRGRRDGQSRGNTYNTTLYFWNSQTVTASEFSTWLDKFPRDTQIVLVMVQCYAGGFAHTIFEHADAKAGLSPRRSLRILRPDARSRRGGLHARLQRSRLRGV